GLESDGAAVLVEVLQGRLRHGDLVVQVAVFAGQVGGHDLGQAGRVPLHIGVEGVERFTGVELQQHGRAHLGGEDLRRGGGVQGREVGDGIGDGGYIHRQHRHSLGQQQNQQQDQCEGFTFHMYSYSDGGTDIIVAAEAEAVV